MNREYRSALLEEIVANLEPNDTRKWIVELAFDMSGMSPLEILSKLEEVIGQSYERGYNEGRKQQRLDHL